MVIIMVLSNKIYCLSQWTFPQTKCSKKYGSQLVAGCAVTEDVEFSLCDVRLSLF